MDHYNYSTRKLIQLVIPLDVYCLWSLTSWIKLLKIQWLSIWSSKWNENLTTVQCTAIVTWKWIAIYSLNSHLEVVNTGLASNWSVGCGLIINEDNCFLGQSNMIYLISPTLPPYFNAGRVSERKEGEYLLHWVTDEHKTEKKSSLYWSLQ